MTSLPEHWESDYDGNRWFYRYRPTGIVQYTFPKPGDEYPEYIDASAPPLDLPPEEKLVSQQQLKRRSTAERSGSLSNKSKDGSNEVTSATLAKGEGGFWFEPDYMYLGNVSPLQEEIEEELRLVTEQQAKEKAAAAAAAAAAIRTDDGSQPHISPYTSAGTTPLTSNSKPVTGTPEIDGAAVATRESPRNAARAQPTRQSPVGFVAELPSEITAKCREDTHPTPVELPGHHHVSGEESQPAQWVDAFDIAPVELPAQPASVGRREHSDDVRQRPAQLVKSLAHQAPASQHEPRASHPPRDVASSSASGFQPYNPNQRAVAEYNANRRSQVMNQVQPEDVPSILRPPKPPPKQPLDAMANAKQPDTPFLSKAVANSRVPSVLQPARGRPNLPLDTSQNDRQTSPPKTYQPYSPLQERQGNAPSAAEHLSRTNDQQRVGPSQLRQATPQTHALHSHDSRPTVPPRTNTLPSHMPSLPFIGAPALDSVSAQPESLRPSHAPRAQSDYNITSQAGRASAPPKGEVDLSAYMTYSNPITPSDPNLPKPLNFTRPAATRRVAELANTIPSVELPVSTLPDRNNSTSPAQYALETEQQTHDIQKPPSGIGAGGVDVTRHSSYSQESSLPRHKHPEDRPSTAFSVVSDFSVMSESSISSTSQRSFRDRVEASKSPTPGVNKPETKRTPNGLGLGKSFLVADAGFVISSGPTTSIPSPSPSDTHPPSLSNAPAPRIASSGISNQQHYLRHTGTPPPNPQAQRPQSNSQSPNSKTSSPSAPRTSVSGAPVENYDRRHSVQSQGSAHSASSQNQPLPAQRPRLSSGGPQMATGQASPRPSSVSSPLNSSSSQQQASSPYVQQPQGARPLEGQRPGHQPSHSYQQSFQHHFQAQQTQQQMPGAYIQPHAGWQPQIPQNAHRPSPSAAPKPTAASRPPKDANNPEAGRRHSASVGQSMTPPVAQMYAPMQGGSQHTSTNPIQRPESVPVGISHQSAQPRPSIPFYAWQAPGSQPSPGGYPQGVAPQPGQPGMPVHSQIQGLRPSAVPQQPAAVPVGKIGQAPARPPQVDASGKDKRRNKLQKAGGPRVTQPPPAAPQTGPLQYGKPNTGAQFSAPVSAPQPQMQASQGRPAQKPLEPAARPTGSQQSQPTSFQASAQTPISSQSPQRPPQGQQVAPAASTQQHPQQPAWAMHSQPHPAPNLGPSSTPGAIPYHVPSYQMAHAVRTPPGQQAPQNVFQQPQPAQEGRRQPYHVAQAAPIPQTSASQQQLSMSNRQTMQHSQHSTQSLQSKLQPQQPQQKPAGQEYSQQNSPRQEDHEQKPLQGRPLSHHWGGQTEGQLTRPSETQVERQGQDRRVSQPAAPYQAPAWVDSGPAEQPSADRQAQHRQSVGQVQPIPPATHLPQQGSQNQAPSSGIPAVRPARQHEQTGQIQGQRLQAQPAQPTQAKQPEPKHAQPQPAPQPQTGHAKASFNSKSASTQHAAAQGPETYRQPQYPAAQSLGAKKDENPYEQHRQVPQKEQTKQSPPQHRLEPAAAPKPQSAGNVFGYSQHDQAGNEPRQPVVQQQLIQNQRAVASNGGPSQLLSAQPNPAQPSKPQPTTATKPPTTQPQPRAFSPTPSQDKVTPNVVDPLPASTTASSDNKTSSAVPAKTTAGGWGDSSGYDGSGWGDDDDDYY